MEEQIVRLESGLMNCEHKIDELRSELRSMINELSEDLKGRISTKMTFKL